MFFQLFMFASVAALGATLFDCPSTIQNNAPHPRVFGQRCYSFFYESIRQFDYAEHYCKRDGGHLVKIQDAATQNFLYNVTSQFFQFKYYGEVWIGLSDVSSEGHFVWMDGSPATYTNWAAGEPDSDENFANDVQDCVYMDLRDGGRWHDARCNQTFAFISNIQRPFICEYPAVQHTTT